MISRRELFSGGGAATAQLLVAAKAPAHLSLASVDPPLLLQMAQGQETTLQLVSPAPDVVPLAVQAATGQTAPLQEWRDSTATPQFSVMADGRPGLVPQAWRGDGRTKPALAFASDPNTGFTQMPGVIDNGSIAIISKGFFAASLEMSSSAFVLSTRTTNRLMLLSRSAIVLASASGHYEIESGAGPNYESSITGYRIGTAVSSTVVFNTDPTVAAACPLAVRLTPTDTVDAFQIRASDDDVLTRVDYAGRVVTGAHVPPSLDDLRDGEMTWWLDAATGDVKITTRLQGVLSTLSLTPEAA